MCACRLTLAFTGYLCVVRVRTHTQAVYSTRPYIHSLAASVVRRLLGSPRDVILFSLSLSLSRALAPRASCFCPCSSPLPALPASRHACLLDAPILGTRRSHRPARAAFLIRGNLTMHDFSFSDHFSFSRLIFAFLIFACTSHHSYLNYLNHLFI